MRNGLSGQIARRVLHAVAVALVSASLGFAVLHLVPGDGLTVASERSVGDARAREAARTAARTRLGLDRPLLVQYRNYLLAVSRGDLGVSIVERRNVTDVLRTAVAASTLLCGSALVLAVLLGASVGIVQGWRPRAPVGRVFGTLLTTLYAMPEFVLAIGLITLLAYGAALFPVGGVSDPVIGIVGSAFEQLRDRLWHLTLPAVALALGWSATIARQQRIALLEIGNADFVRTARAKGVSSRALLLRHALPPSLPAVLATIGTMLPVVVGGAVVVESLFAWPGMGMLMLRAIGARDYPVLSGAVLVVGVMVSASSLLADVVSTWLDPRQRVVA